MKTLALILLACLPVLALAQGLTSTAIGHLNAPWVDGGAGGATKWYVQAGGSGDGHTAAAPLATIGEAILEAVAGDSIFIRAGTYNETLTLHASGSLGGGYIVMVNYAGEEVLVRGADGTTNGTSDLFLSAGFSYFIAQGIHFWHRATYTDADRSYEIDVSGGDHIKFRYCTVTNATITDASTVADVQALWETNNEKRGFVLGAEYSTVEYCNVRGFGENIVIAGTGPRHTLIRESWVHLMTWNGIIIVTDDPYEFQHNYIVNCLIENSAGEDAIQWQPSDPSAEGRKPDNVGTIVSNCVLRNCAENATDFKGAAFALVEKCIIYGIQGDDDGTVDGNANDENSGMAVEIGYADSSNIVIVRQSIVYDSHGGIRPGTNWQAYNNTVWSNNRNYTGTQSSTTTFGMLMDNKPLGTIRQWFNNLVVNQTAAEVKMTTRGSTDISIDNNAYFNHARSAEFDYMGSASPDNVIYTATGLAAWQQVMQDSTDIFSGHAGKEVNSIEGDPLLTSITDHPAGAWTTYNFTPTVSSPLVDAGRELTTVSAGVTSATFTVANSWGICDGWEAVGREGDSLCIIHEGAKVYVRATSIDYSSHAVTVDRSITVYADDKVYLWPFAGAGPDIGAKEYGIAEAFRGRRQCILIRR